MNPLLKEIAALREENEELRAHIKWLNPESDSSFIVSFIEKFRLTRSEAHLLSALYRREGPLSRDTLVLHLPGAKANPRNVDTHLCRIRAKLKCLDLRINAHWGAGWRIPQKEKDKIKAVLEA